MLGAKTYTLYRTEPGQFIEGVWTPGLEEQLSARGSLQPMRPKETEVLPEGLRNRARWRFYCKATLLLANEEAGQAADQVLIDGERLEVAAVEDFTRGISGSLVHHKYILAEPSGVGAGGGL